MMKYYVYILIDPRNSKPFYVGKGSSNRAEWHTTQIKNGSITDNRHKDNIIKKILQARLEPLIHYVYYTDDEDHAYEIETNYILEYGRKNIDEAGILTNICTDNNPPHEEYSTSRREIYRQRMIGNTINTGRIQTTAEKQKRSDSLKRAYDSGERVMSENTRQIISKTHKGKIITETTRKNMRRAAAPRKVNKGKTYEEIYGITVATLMREKIKNRMPTNQKPIIIDGIHYPSITAAARKLTISEYKAKKRNKQ